MVSTVSAGKSVINGQRRNGTKNDSPSKISFCFYAVVSLHLQVFHLIKNITTATKFGNVSNGYIFFLITAASPRPFNGDNTGSIKL